MANNKKTYPILDLKITPKAIYAVIIFLAFEALIVYGTYAISFDKGMEVGYNNGWNEAMSDVEDKITQSDNVQNDLDIMLSFKGTILEKKDGQLILQAANLSKNPLTPTPAKRTVNIDGATILMARRQKSAEEINKERLAFSEAIKKYDEGTLKERPQIYTYFTTEIVKPDNFEVGEEVTVEANENIKTKAEFTASRITVFRQ